MIRSVVAVLMLSAVAAPAGAGWVRVYGPMKAHTKALVPVADGGAAVLTSGSPGVLFTTDSSGNVVASRELEHQATFLARGSAGSFYAGGASLSGGEPELELLKLDRDLGVLWTARLVPAEVTSFQPVAAISTTDGGLIVAGMAGNAAFVLRTAAAGGVEWARKLDASGYDLVNAIVQTRDGGIVCAGSSREKPWLVKLTAKGELAWHQVYPNTSGGFRTVVETADGDLIAAGSHLLIARVAADGSARWQRTLRLDRVHASTLVAIAKDAFAVSALTEKRAVLVSFRGDGTQLWQQAFTAGNGESLSAGVPRSGDLAPVSGGLFYTPAIFGGPTMDPLTYLIRIDADGTTGCPWFSASSIPFADASSPAERMALDVAPLTVEKRPWETKVTPAVLIASPIACAPVAPVAAVSSASTFDRFAVRRQQERDWEPLLRAKDFTRLESIANELRAKPWSADPLHWDTSVFYAMLNWANAMDEATVLATLREWIAARPQSITPKIALAQTLTSAAWRRRGGGYADTVTTQDGAVYQTLLDEADRTLMALQGAEADPHYWALSVQLAHLQGRDPVQVARRAAKHTHNPEAFAFAALALSPQWGNRVAEFRPFVEEAAALTRTAMGDGMYAWLTYQAYFLMGEKAGTLGLEWSRARQGMRDLIRIAPQWIPSYHRFALMARWTNDRATAREMFQRKELDWYNGAATMWSRAAYNETREWALGTPAETFIDNAPRPATPVAAAPKLKTAPPAAPPIAQWPQMLMQNEVVIDGAAQPPSASFLVETPSGVVAVSAVRDFRPETSPDNLTQLVRERLTSWKMAAPATPKRVFTVQSIDTRDAPDHQRGLALVLAPFKGKMPVHVLKPDAPDAPPENVTGRIFVVSCTWTGPTCTQTITPGRIVSADQSRDGKRATYFLRTEKPLDPEAAMGGAVLDEDGHAIAVMNGAASMTTPEGTLLDAVDLRSIIRR